MLVAVVLVAWVSQSEIELQCQVKETSEDEVYIIIQYIPVVACRIKFLEATGAGPEGADASSTVASMESCDRFTGREFMIEIIETPTKWGLVDGADLRRSSAFMFFQIAPVPSIPLMQNATRCNTLLFKSIQQNPANMANASSL